MAMRMQAGKATVFVDGLPIGEVKDVAFEPADDAERKGRVPQSPIIGTITCSGEYKIPVHEDIGVTMGALRRANSDPACPITLTIHDDRRVITVTGRVVCCASGSRARRTKPRRLQYRLKQRWRGIRRREKQ